MTNDRFALIEGLPPNIKNELVLLMQNRLVKDLHFFQDQPRDFILYVLPILKPLTLYKGDVVFSVGEYLEEIFLVLEGVLSLHLGSSYNNFEVAQILPNYHFGDILIYLNEI